MNLKNQFKPLAGLTRLEILVVVLVVFILFGLITPPNSHAKRKAQQINCVNNLKQVGLSFRLWSEDHGGLYPMQYRTNDFDGPSFANGKQMPLWFQIMSNELLMPKIVVCPADDRSPATNFTSDFGPAHVSYFVGASGSRPSPTDFLSGDSNLTNDLVSQNGPLEISAKNVLRWGGKRHEDNGNVLFTDGKVQKLSNRDLRVAIIQLGEATNKAVMPQ